MAGHTRIEAHPEYRTAQLDGVELTVSNERPLSNTDMTHAPSARPGHCRTRFSAATVRTSSNGQSHYPHLLSASGTRTLSTRTLTVLTALLLSVAGHAIASDGEILHQERFVPKYGYAEWFDRAFAASDSPEDPAADIRAARQYYTPARYEELLKQAKVTTDRIVYENDGLKISGFIVRPARPSGRLPVILWCRGGIGQYAAVNTGDLLIMNNWARAGYVVIASNYRGGPGSEGRDEDGGDDVDDVKALVPLAKSLPYADTDQLFLYGQSRGGTMVYRALADGLPARAAVVNSGVSDLSRSDRPDAAEMDALMRAAMPDYETEKANRFCRRSAICWPEKLKVPLLLLHGTADWRVPADQTLALATRLQSLRSPYALHIIEGGTHVTLDQNQARIDKWILDFFAAHRQQ